ncbi:MAG: hypothetical protein IJH75_06280 [Mogibacterium sp.]|nr:hypothetical protein [Mogibacterium sp.]
MSIIRRAVGVILLIAAVCFSVWYLQEHYFYRADRNQLALGGFYLEDDDSLDVVLLGSSEVYSAFYSGLAYRQEGFTSYPYSYQANPITVWPYELREILMHQHPKVLIVEANGAVYDDTLFKPASIRKLTDNIPFSRNKMDLVERYGTVSSLSYYLPLIKYHGMYFESMKAPEPPEGQGPPDEPEYVPEGFSEPVTETYPWLTILYPDLGPVPPKESGLDNWFRLDDKTVMQERGYSLLKGCLSHTRRRKTHDDIDLTTIPRTTDLDPAAEASLNEFLDLCDASGIEHVVFARFPHRVTSERTIESYQRYNRLAEIVQARGYDYIDFTDHWEAIGLDAKWDFFDVDHLNALGAEKFTAYLSRYLVEHYGVQPSRLDARQTAAWEESARYTEAFLRYARHEIENFNGHDRGLEERAETVEELTENYL